MINIFIYYTSDSDYEIDIIFKLSGYIPIGGIYTGTPDIGGYYIVTDGFYKNANLKSAVNIFGSKSVFYRQGKKEKYTFTVCNSLNDFLEKLAEYD